MELIHIVKEHDKSTMQMLPKKKKKDQRNEEEMINQILEGNGLVSNDRLLIGEDQSTLFKSSSNRNDVNSSHSIIQMH